MKAASSQIDAIVNRHIDTFISENWSDGSEFKSVDFTELLDKIFNSIIHLILFDDPAADDIKVEGNSLSMSIEKSLNMHILEMSSLTNVLSFGILSYFGIGPHIWEGKRLEGKIRKTIDDIYDRRINEPIRSGINLIDLIKKDNEKRPEGKKWTKQDVTTHMVMFEALGSDTTKAFSKNMFFRFAREPEVLNLFLERIEALKE